MLRGLLILLLALNLAVWAFVRNDPSWGQGEREPQRLQGQIAASAVRWVPEAASGAASGAASDAASGATPGEPDGAASPQHHDPKQCSADSDPVEHQVARNLE